MISNPGRLVNQILRTVEHKRGLGFLQPTTKPKNSMKNKGWACWSEEEYSCYSSFCGSASAFAEGGCIKGITHRGYTSRTLKRRSRRLAKA